MFRGLEVLSILGFRRVAAGRGGSEEPGLACADVPPSRVSSTMGY